MKWLELLYHNVLYYSDDKKSLKQLFGPSFTHYDEQVRSGVIPLSHDNNLDDSVYSETSRDFEEGEHDGVKDHGTNKDNLIVEEEIKVALEKAEGGAKVDKEVTAEVLKQLKDEEREH